MPDAVWAEYVHIIPQGVHVIAEPKDLRVINLWGGPGAGKSTTRSRLFHEMKRMGLRVEEATEFAKDLTYAKDFGTLTNQLVVLAEQDRRIRRLVGQVDWVVSDSPLPLGLVYSTPEYGEWFRWAVKGAYTRYTNYDVLLERRKAYATFGRNQTESEARSLDIEISKCFAWATVGHIERTLEIPGDDLATPNILAFLGRIEPGSIPFREVLR